MSQENVEITRAAIEAFNRRDLDTFVALGTPDFEWLPAISGAFDSGSYRGREGVETYFEEMRDTWEEFRVVIEELRDLGDRVLLLGQFEGHGKGSGVSVGSPVGMLIEFRGGKALRARSFLDHAEALRAAGLSGASGQADG